MKIVAESETVLAFEHTQPTWQIRIVVIPKQHVRQIVEVSDPLLFSELFRIIIQIIKERGFTETNYKIVTNGGPYQSTQHLHFHLVSGVPIDPDNPIQKGELAV